MGGSVFTIGSDGDPAVAGQLQLRNWLDGVFRPGLQRTGRGEMLYKARKKRQYNFIPLPLSLKTQCMTKHICSYFSFNLQSSCLLVFKLDPGVCDPDFSIGAPPPQTLERKNKSFSDYVSLCNSIKPRIAQKMQIEQQRRIKENTFKNFADNDLDSAKANADQH